MVSPTYHIIAPVLCSGNTFELAERNSMPSNGAEELLKALHKWYIRLLHWRAWLEWSLLHTAPSLRINDGLARPASSSGRKDTNLPPFVRKSSEFGDLATERSFLEGLNGLRHRLRHPSSSKAAIWKLLTLTFSTFFRASTLRPGSVCTRSSSRAHTFWYVTMVVAIEATAPKRRSRKTPFWSTLDTLIFLLFSNLCCLGSCAAVATLKQMLANNCYETFDRSVFFDLGPRTMTLVNVMSQRSAKKEAVTWTFNLKRGVKDNPSKVSNT